MRNFADITEEEVKAVYEQTPEVNKFATWEDVKKCEPIYIALKNKIIAHEQETNMESNKPFLAIDNGSNARQTRIVRAENTEKQNNKRRSTITLHEQQIKQLCGSLTLARNCLQCGGIGDEVKLEALQELSKSQQAINALLRR